MDRTGRLRRLALALVLASAAFAIVWTITNNLAKPDEISSVRVASAYKFIWYFSGGAFTGVFALTIAVANARAKRKWQRDRDVPEAKQIS
jgi:hypothetical protein